MSRHADRIVCDQIIEQSEPGCLLGQCLIIYGIGGLAACQTAPVPHTVSGGRMQGLLLRCALSTYSCLCAGYRGWNWGRGDYYCRGRESFASHFKLMAEEASSLA